MLRIEDLSKVPFLILGNKIDIPGKGLVSGMELWDGMGWIREWRD